MMHGRGIWEGSAGELLADLTDNEDLKKRRDWPKSARKMSSALRRLAPNLRAVGIDVSHFRKGTIERGNLPTGDRL